VSVMRSPSRGRSTSAPFTSLSNHSLCSVWTGRTSFGPILSMARSSSSGGAWPEAWKPGSNSSSPPREPEPHGPHVEVLQPGVEPLEVEDLLLRVGLAAGVEVGPPLRLYVQEVGEVPVAQAEDVPGGTPGDLRGVQHPVRQLLQQVLLPGVLRSLQPPVDPQTRQPVPPLHAPYEP